MLFMMLVQSKEKSLPLRQHPPGENNQISIIWLSEDKIIELDPVPGTISIASVGIYLALQQQAISP